MGADIIKTKPKPQRCSDKEAVAAYRRVLRLVHKYMRANLDDETLVAFGGGMMTWGEIRWHMQSALALQHPLMAKPRRRHK